MEPRNWVLTLALLTLTGCAALDKSLGRSEPSFLVVTHTWEELGGLHGPVSGKMLCELVGVGRVRGLASDCNCQCDPALGPQGILGLMFREVGYLWTVSEIPSALISLELILLNSTVRLTLSGGCSECQPASSLGAVQLPCDRSPSARGDRRLCPLLATLFGVTVPGCPWGPLRPHSCISSPLGQGPCRSSHPRGPVERTQAPLAVSVTLATRRPGHQDPQHSAREWRSSSWTQCPSPGPVLASDRNTMWMMKLFVNCLKHKSFPSLHH